MAIHAAAASYPLANVLDRSEQGEFNNEERDIFPPLNDLQLSERQTIYSIDPRASGSTSHDPVVEDFFSAKDGSSLVTEFHYDAPAITSQSSHAWRSCSMVNLSTKSTTSLATLLPPLGGYGGQLDHLCGMISTHTEFQSARIRSTECYSRSIAFGVVHRYLLLELERTGKKAIWLRLDRRPSKTIGTWQFIRSRGSTGANDTIQISSQRETLVNYQDKRENLQQFERTPTLVDLRIVLSIVSDRLATYEIWPRNCWFFVSLIQETLSVSGVGSFTVGQISSIGLDRHTREIILNEVRESRFAAITLAARQLGELDDSIAKPNDVSYYIQRTLEEGNLAIGTREIAKIVECAGGSLVWAVTACRFFLYFTPHQNSHHQDTRHALIRRVINSGGGRLPVLYGIILDHYSKFTTSANVYANVHSCISLREPVRWVTLCKIAPHLFKPEVFFPLPVISDCRSLNPMIAAPHPSFLTFLQEHYLQRNSDYKFKEGRFVPDPALIKQIENHDIIERRRPLVAFVRDDLMYNNTHKNTPSSLLLPS